MAYNEDPFLIRVGSRVLYVGFNLQCPQQGGWLTLFIHFCGPRRKMGPEYLASNRPFGSKRWGRRAADDDSLGLRTARRAAQRREDGRRFSTSHPVRSHRPGVITFILSPLASSVRRWLGFFRIVGWFYWWAPRACISCWIAVLAGVWVR